MRKKYLKNKKITSALQDALLKKAMGYDSSETVEEYSNSDNELTLTKKKVTIKHIPPDTTALKALLELCEVQNKEDDLVQLSDQELEQEKQRILKELKGDE